MILRTREVLCLLLENILKMDNGQETDKAIDNILNKEYKGAKLLTHHK